MLSATRSRNPSRNVSGWHWLRPVLLLPLLLVAGQAQAQAKVGFVSLDRILREAPVAQRAQKKIEQEFARRDQELAKMAEQLKKMQETLEKNSVTMTETDRQKRERELGDLNRDFQRKQREFREDLTTRRNEELSGVIATANAAIKKIAETEKFDIIFQDAVWASPKIDITDKVIKALGEASPPAASPAAK
jgi:outer membrane protein